VGGEQVEGRQAVRELLLAGRRRVHEVLLAHDADGDAVEDIVELARERRATVRRVPRAELESQARSEAPQGVLARAVPLGELGVDDVLAGIPSAGPTRAFLVALDGVTDPGNLGAVLRCCDGAGVDAVLLPKHRAVHVTPTVAKAAAGAIEHVAIALAPGLPSALERLKAAGVWLVGLDDAADRSLFDLGALATDHVCLVLGAEGAGLSRLVRERCDVVASIPMLGQLSSLNVSAAAALACYEVARARLGTR
jgi:23S rRNA (guanosine2251-2'-O)-methyltransferase